MEKPDGFHRIEFVNKFADAQKQAALDNIRSSCARNLETITRMQEPHGMTAVIVGSGPSARHELETIREMGRRDDVCVFSVNESHDWLIENEIDPWAAVYIEVVPWGETLFKKQATGTTFFIASQCDPSVFDQIGDRRTVLWHAHQGIGEENVVNECQGGGCTVAGGATPSMRAIHLGVVLGFRDFHLFGMDSSYETNSHAMRDDQRTDFAADMTMEVWSAGRMFKTKPYLAQQAESFAKLCTMYERLLSFRVYGDGLLPHIHRTLYPQYYQEKAA